MYIGNFGPVENCNPVNHILNKNCLISRLLELSWNGLINPAFRNKAFRLIFPVYTILSIEN